MEAKVLCRAKRKDNGKWIEGCYVRQQKTTYCFKEDYEADPDNTVHYIAFDEMTDWGLPNRHLVTEIDVSTLCFCTGKEYMDTDIAYEGDIFESQVSGDLMILRYGTYQAYCPGDRTYVDSVGFYAECKGYPDMPIGDLKEYALKKGNIYDNPELLEEI